MWLRRTFRSAAIGCFLIIVALSPSSMERLLARPQTASSPTPPGDWTTFSVPIDLTQLRVTAAGIPVQSTLLHSSYRLDRRLVDGIWRTTFYVATAPDVLVKTPNGDIHRTYVSVGHIDYAGDGTPLQYFDSHGRRVSLPTLANLQSLLKKPIDVSRSLKADTTRAGSTPRHPDTGVEWLSNFIFPASTTADRVSILKATLGTPTGQVANFDRYVLTDGVFTREILLDTSAGTIVELNVARNGLLQSHTTFTYAARADGSMARQRTRIEVLIPDKSGDRAVTDVVFGEIALSLSGGSTR